MEYMQEIEFTLLFPMTSPKCPLRKRKVQFVNDKDLVQIREFEDDEESRQNRQLYWEFYAVDRFRFKDRVHRTEHALGDKIFSPGHRDKVYNERIAPYLRKQEEEDSRESCEESINSESASNASLDVTKFVTDKEDLSCPDKQDLSSCPPVTESKSVSPEDVDLEEDCSDPESDLDKMECQISSHQLTVVLPCCPSSTIATSTSASSPSLSVAVHPSSASTCCLLHILNHA